MQTFIRAVGIGLGAVVAFIFACYAVASASIKLCEPLRDLYNDGYASIYSKDGNETIRRIVFGFMELGCFAFCVYGMFILGMIILA